MSTIGVMYHDEDIHNIIHKPVAPLIMSPRYKSKKKSFTKKEEVKLKKGFNGHQTFGLPHYKTPESCNYLKKTKPKIPPPPKKKTDREKRPPIPKFSFQTKKRTIRNFVKENVITVANIKCKMPPPRRVETPRGTVKDLAHLFQMIKIRDSDEYGKIPKYLCERRQRWVEKEEKRRISEQAVKEYKEKMGIGTMGMSDNVFMISQETRQKLLDGMKENWNELSKQFLRLPVMLDSWHKIKRKAMLEQRIERLEKDIKLLETHPYIYLERQDTRPLEILASIESQMNEPEKVEEQKEKEEKKDDKEKKDEKEKEKDEKEKKDEEKKTEEKEKKEEECLEEPIKQEKKEEEEICVNY